MNIIMYSRASKTTGTAVGFSRGGHSLRPGARRGHWATEVFSFRSRGHYGISRRLVILWRAGLYHSARDYTAVIHCGHGVTRDCKVWSGGHSRISVDINCVPSVSHKYSTYGSDHPSFFHPWLVTLLSISNPVMRCAPKFNVTFDNPLVTQPRL